MKTILITLRPDHSIASAPNCNSGFGGNVAEAIGNLIIQNPEQFNINSIRYNSDEYTRISIAYTGQPAIIATAKSNTR